jgi:hypothetical protein
MRAQALAAVLCATQLCACAGTIAVKTGNPRPNINLGKSDQKMKLDLAEGVRDAFKQPGSNTMAPFEMTGWRGTLKNAFKNSFGNFYAVVDDGADVTLQVEEAELSFVPAAVEQGGNTVAIRAQVRYRANVVDATGAVVKRLAGTVESKQAVSDRDAVGRAADSAVETMFETIANEAFTGK